MAVTENASDYGISVDASRRAYFETPVVVAHLEGAAGLIADLKAAIDERKETHPGLERSNIGGWHSDAGMPNWGGEAARTLANHAIALAREHTYLHEHDWRAVAWAVQMWANVSGPGAQNAVHVHPGNLWAAVFYVDLGEGEAEPGGCGGELYFEDPRFPGAYMHATAFRPRGADGGPLDWQTDIKPRAGDLVLFPSWLRHGVRPYRGEAQRISIAMNLDPILNNATKR